MTPQYVGLSMETIDPETGIQDLHLDENNNIAMASGVSAISQHVWQRIKTFQGEWFLDNQAGVPWLSQVLGRPYNPGLAEALIKTVVMETAGVTGITEFSVSFDQRLRHVSNVGRSISVTTIYDEEVSI